MVDCFLILLLMVVTALYFLPSIIAVVQDRRNMVAIIFFNILLGWIPLLWIVAFIWSLIEDK